MDGGSRIYSIAFNYFIYCTVLYCTVQYQKRGQKAHSQPNTVEARESTKMSKTGAESTQIKGLESSFFFDWIKYIEVFLNIQKYDVSK
jgi:hypothetical protein